MTTPRRGTRRSAMRRISLTVAALAGLLAVGTPAASAHTDLVETEPSLDAQVNSGTASVLLAFDDQVLPDLVEAEVTDRAGRDHMAGDAIIDGGRVLLPLEPLAKAGDYTVTYHVVAADGHEVDGTYDFTLTPTGAADAASVTTPDPSLDPFDDAHRVGPRYDAPEGLPVPTWVFLGAGGLGLVLLLRQAASRSAGRSEAAEAAEAADDAADRDEAETAAVAQPASRS